MTNESGRMLQLPLGFLKRGAYRLTEYADGRDDAAPTQVTATTKSVKAGETLTLTLVPSGGYAAHLSPAK